MSHTSAITKMDPDPPRNEITIFCRYLQIIGIVFRAEDLNNKSRARKIRGYVGFLVGLALFARFCYSIYALSLCSFFTPRYMFASIEVKFCIVGFATFAVLYKVIVQDQFFYRYLTILQSVLAAKASVGQVKARVFTFIIWVICMIVGHIHCIGNFRHKYQESQNIVQLIPIIILYVLFIICIHTTAISMALFRLSFVTLLNNYEEFHDEVEMLSHQKALLDIETLSLLESKQLGFIRLARLCVDKLRHLGMILFVFLLIFVDAMAGECAFYGEKWAKVWYPSEILFHITMNGWNILGPAAMMIVWKYPYELSIKIKSTKDILLLDESLWLSFQTKQHQAIAKRMIKRARDVNYHEMGANAMPLLLLLAMGVQYGFVAAAYSANTK